MKMYAHPNSNHVMPPPPEAQYRRDGYYENSKGQFVWYSLCHSSQRCDVCEFPIGNERQHPRDPESQDLLITCDERRVKLIPQFSAPIDE